MLTWAQRCGSTRPTSAQTHSSVRPSTPTHPAALPHLTFQYHTQIPTAEHTSMSPERIYEWTGTVTIPTQCGAFGTQSFKTEQGNALCQQALQQGNLGLAQYKSGNFANANTSFKSAQTYWNQALQAESSDAGTQSVATMTSGWGTLLLGIGGVLAGVGATVYAFKRPRGLSSAVSNPSASTSALMPSK